MQKIVFLLAFLFIATVLSAQSDITAVQDAVQNVDDGDFAPGLLFLVMLAMVTLVVGFFLVAIVSVLAVAIIMGLTAVGILSASIGMGLYKRSFYAGIKWFVYLSSGTWGMAAVALIGLFIKLYWPKAVAYNTMLSWGLPAGFIGGLAGGWAVLFIGRKLYVRFVQQKGLLKA